MDSEMPTLLASSHSQWTCPEEGKLTRGDVGHQHLDDILDIRAGACLQLARLAAGGQLDATSALAVTEQAIGKVLQVYDNHQTEVYLCEQANLVMPLNMAEEYFALINQQ